MAVKNTIINIIDNSGAFEAQCIQILKKGNSPKAELGDILRVVIVKTKTRSKIKTGALFLAQVVRLRTKRTGNTCFHNAGAVLIQDKNKTPIGNKILGPIDFSILARFPLLALLCKSQFH